MPKEQLADLEHDVIHSLLANYGAGCNGPAQLQGYLREAWFLTAYPQYLVPFREGAPSLKIFLTFDDDKQECTFCEKNEKGYPVPRESPLGISRFQIDAQASKRLWLTRDYENEIVTLAEQKELSLRSVSLRYGELSFRHDEKAKYQYNDQFGLVKM
jgi:CRISPR-associated endonuclease/helicase Cas3